MPKFVPMALFMGVVQALLGVGALLLLQAVMQAFSPGWALPFSAFWGLLLGAPALAVGLFAGRG